MKLAYKGLLVLGILLSFFHQISFAQCQAKIDYVVKKESGLYSISLKADQQVVKTQVQLYDLNLGKVVEEKTLDLHAGSNATAFVHVKPSTYSIIVRIAGCEKIKSLGGVTGIILENKQD